MIKKDFLKYKFDLVLIDGDHTNEGAMQDWLNIKDCLVGKKSIVFFDDFNLVSRAFDFIEARKKVIEKEFDYGVVYY